MATIRLKHNLSSTHFEAARLFAGHAEQVESAARTNGAPDNASMTVQCYAAGAVVSVVAGLESWINELFLYAEDRNMNALKGLSSEQLSDIAAKREAVEMDSILSKYETALSIAQRPPMNRGALPYQDADRLIDLRNALVHFKPEWDDKLKHHARLLDRLRGRFPENPLASIHGLWFPHRCLGSGCAWWGVKVTRDFLADFSARMGIPARSLPNVK